MTTPVRVYLGLGSNLGDSRALLCEAVEAFDELGELEAVSALYRTAPVGGPEQDPFLNLVISLSTDRSVWAVLDTCQALERAAHRTREVRWGPRTLDVDVLLYGDLHLDTPTLTVPHPRMWERRFVLQPLADLAPDLLPEGWEQGVADQDIDRIEERPCCS